MKRWILTILLAIDQLINAIFGGYADETISFRMAMNAQLGGFWGCWFCKIIEIFWKDHCDLKTKSKADKLARGTSYINTHGGV